MSSRKENKKTKRQKIEKNIGETVQEAKHPNNSSSRKRKQRENKGKELNNKILLRNFPETKGYESTEYPTQWMKTDPNQDTL